MRSSQFRCSTQRTVQYIARQNTLARAYPWPWRGTIDLPGLVRAPQITSTIRIRERGARGAHRKLKLLVYISSVCARVHKVRLCSRIILLFNGPVATRVCTRVAYGVRKSLYIDTICIQMWLWAASARLSFTRNRSNATPPSRRTINSP